MANAQQQQYTRSLRALPFNPADDITWAEWLEGLERELRFFEDNRKQMTRKMRS